MESQQPPPPPSSDPAVPIPPLTVDALEPDYINLVILVIFGIIVYFVLDRVFYCFRKPPSNATISLKSLIKPEKPEDRPYNVEQLSTSHISEEERKRRISEIRSSQQNALMEKAAKVASEKKVKALIELEERARKVGLKVWLFSKGTTLGSDPDKAKEYEERMNRLQSVGLEEIDEEEIKRIEKQITELENTQEQHEQEKKGQQLAADLSKIKERITNKSKESTGKEEEEEDYWPSNHIEYDRHIKKQQDKEFQESLRVDKKKQRERENKFKAEQEAQRVTQERLDVRKAKAESMMPEPEDSELCCSILLRLPSGRRITRRFYKDEKLDTLFGFIESSLTEGTDQNLVEYIIATHFPRQVISGVSGDATIQNTLGKDKSHTLFVEKP